MRRAAISITTALACLAAASSGQEAPTDESVRKKSERIGDQIDGLLQDLGARPTDAATPDLDDAPVQSSAPVSTTDPAAPGFAAILRTALGRAPTEREAALFAGAHPGLTPAQADVFAGVPVQLAAATDAQTRLALYEAHSAHAYCDFQALIPKDELAAMFADDPVLAARCGEGGPLVLRRSAWRAARWQMDFAAALIGAPQVTEEDAADLLAQAPAYVATGELDRVRFWTDATSLAAKAQAQWAVLGATEAGRARQAKVVAYVRAAPADAVSRSGAFRAETHRQHALADFNAFLDANNEVSLAVTKGVLEQSCLWGASIVC